MNDRMTNQELCLLLDSILSLIKVKAYDEAERVIQNGIDRIDKGITSSSSNNTNNNA